MSQSWYCSLNRNVCVLNTSVWKRSKHTDTTFSEIVCKQYVAIHDLSSAMQVDLLICLRSLLYL